MQQGTSKGIHMQILIDICVARWCSYWVRACKPILQGACDVAPVGQNIVLIVIPND